MKKLFPLLLLLMGSIFLSSCKDDNDDVQVKVDYPTVYDLNINLIQNRIDYYGYNQPFDHPMLNQDIVLVYRKNNPGANNPIWEPLPKTYFPNQGTMDYTFNFTKTDVQIDLNADFDLSVQNNTFKGNYLNGQTFRVVLVPAVFGNAKNSDLKDLHKMSYEEVVKKFKIDDSNIGRF